MATRRPARRPLAEVYRTWSDLAIEQHSQWLSIEVRVKKQSLKQLEAQLKAIRAEKTRRVREQKR